MTDPAIEPATGLRPGVLLTEARHSISGARLRTFLAMLGIVIGIASVVLMVAIGTGSRRAVQESIDKLGTNLLILTPGARDTGRGVITKSISSFDLKDPEYLQQLPHVVAATAMSDQREFQVRASKRNWKTSVTGVSASNFTVRNWTMASGERFNEADVAAKNRVAVLGRTVAGKLFPGENPIGAMIRIRSVSFRVIGLLESKGKSLDGRDQDDVIFVPITTAESVLIGRSAYSNVVQTIWVQATSTEDLLIATEEIRAAMRERQKLRESQPDNFTIYDLTAITQVATTTANALSVLLGAIASISLIVGGIGIMNIMLVTVSERTREIGIRKALGARQADILRQFLLEAVLITGIGSVVGLIAGFGFGYAAERFFSAPVAYSLWSVVVALVVACGIGILSGLYPAFKASRLAPIDALRVVGG